MKKIIYQTIKNNIKTLDKVGVLAIDTDNLDNPKQFSDSLKYLQQKGYITYKSSFISIMIKLTIKGKNYIDKGIEFS
jgi:hypothetical protein